MRPALVLLCGFVLAAAAVPLLVSGSGNAGTLRFPVDVIKVDRSFIQGVGQSAKDAAITANLASLAHSLGLVATAEGIESESQLASVRELGCDHAQGFLFARPVPAEQVSALLAGRALGGEARDAVA